MSRFTRKAAEPHAVPAICGHVPDFYALLSLDSGASDGAIRKAIASARSCLCQASWRTLWVRVGGISADLLEEAESVLTDARKRAAYDRRLDHYKDCCRIQQPFW